MLVHIFVSKQIQIRQTKNKMLRIVYEREKPKKITACIYVLFVLFLTFICTMPI